MIYPFNSYLCTMKYQVHQMQPPAADMLSLGKLLPVMEQFYSLQGEGYHSGSPAYFIRIGGCDVGCHWCDVKESWDANLHPLLEIDKVLESVLESGATNVVITGGEPLMYNLHLLTSKLNTLGISTFLETSGSEKLTGNWDWICLSPKKNALPKEDIFLHCNELKMIIHNSNDFLFSEEMASKVSNSCLKFLQPEWSKRETITPLIVEYLKNHTQWRLSLQTHKYIHIP